MTAKLERTSQRTGLKGKFCSVQILGDVFYFGCHKPTPFHLPKHKKSPAITDMKRSSFLFFLYHTNVVQLF